MHNGQLALICLVFLYQVLLDKLAAFALCHELTTVLDDVAHVVLIPDLGLASRALMTSHRACQESLVEYPFSVGVQALDLQVLTTLWADHDRVSDILLGRRRRHLHPLGALHDSVGDEFIYARLTKDDVALAAL